MEAQTMIFKHIPESNINFGKCYPLMNNYKNYK